MIIFVSNTCPRCVPVKKLKQDRSQPIQIINVSETPEYIEQYSLTSVPSMLLDEEIITNVQKIIEVIKGE